MNAGLGSLTLHSFNRALIQLDNINPAFFRLWKSADRGQVHFTIGEKSQPQQSYDAPANEALETALLTEDMKYDIFKTSQGNERETNQAV